MTLRTLAAALVAVGILATPALAQGTRTVHVMGLSFEQPAGPAHAVHAPDLRARAVR